MPAKLPILSIGPAVFYSDGDELALMHWISRIKCIREDSLVFDSRHIYLKRRPSQSDLWEIIALFYRYNLPMRQLAQFENDANRNWFKDQRKVWYKRIWNKGT